MIKIQQKHDSKLQLWHAMLCSVMVCCGLVRCEVVSCGVVWCGVPKALLPKGNGRDVYPRVQVNAGLCVLCARCL